MNFVTNPDFISGKNDDDVEMQNVFNVQVSEYSCMAELPVWCGVSHLSRRNELNIPAWMSLMSGV